MNVKRKEIVIEKKELEKIKSFKRNIKIDIRKLNSDRFFFLDFIFR